MTVTTPLSPVEVEVALANARENLEEAVDAFKQVCKDAAKGEYDYRQAQARFFLIARAEHPELKSDEHRKAWVTTQVADEMWERDRTEGVFNAYREKLKALHADVDILRSLSRSSRDLVDSWHGGSR